MKLFNEIVKASSIDTEKGTAGLNKIAVIEFSLRVVVQYYYVRIRWLAETICVFN